MKVFSSNDDGVGHLCRVNDTGQNSTSDRNVSGERAFLVDVGTVDGLCVCMVSRSVSARLLGFTLLRLFLPSIGLRCGEEIEFTQEESQHTRWGLESQTDVLVPSLSLGGYLLAACWFG